ncbi:hypothetical protein EJB05_48881 [Eragrostis curvula]|uniref:EF-hand domain-containing protein n=1 Tax=Eragrostis curvula TaxID=38414 RepID=A0A5J9T364_9POAL|nr:hypothetical protein EJB05_48881 [Eragrostis curvula]
MGSTSSMLTQYDIEEVQDHCNNVFSQQEIVSLYHRFCQLDRNGGGFVSADEFMSVPEFAVNPLSQRLLRMLDGLNFKEFVAFLSAFSPHTSLQQKIEFIFKVYDTDCNGKVAFDDILSILRDMTGSFMTEQERQILGNSDLKMEVEVPSHALSDGGIIITLLTPMQERMAEPLEAKRIDDSLREENIGSEILILLSTNPTAKMAENDTVQLHKAIFAQYIMMKKLFMELEEEREASATAASAALSLIRKLQKEKDAERMEAWQYKRIAEEKMNHTDGALEVLKELVEQKELEISYLRNQMQMYKHKLLDAGIDVCDIADETIASNIPLSVSNKVENPCHSIKRNFSLPSLQLNKLFADTGINKNDGGAQSARSRLDGYTHNVIDNQWEQVPSDHKALEPMKSFSKEMNYCEKNREELNSPSSGILQHNQPLDESSCCSSFSVVSRQTDTCSERVPQATQDVVDTIHSDQQKDFSLGSELDERAVHPTSAVSALQSPDRSQTETGPSCNENDLMTEESELCITVAPKERGPHALSRFAATRKVGSMNNVDRHVRISTGNCTPRAVVQRSKSRLKRVQSEKMIELKDPRASKEQIIMLNEVYQQLNMIESHMRPSGSQESPRNDASLDSVMEAALSFSL